MAEPYLRQHRGHWQFKIAVPRDLREAFAPRTTIVVSLGHDAKEARLRRWDLKQEWEARFAAMRSGLGITDADIEREARAFYDAEIERIGIRRSEDDLGFELDGNGPSPAFLRAVEAEADRPEVVQPEIDKISRRLGAALPPGSQGHERLANALLAAYHASRVAIEPPASFLPVYARRAAAKIPEPKARAPDKGMKFSEASSRWLAERTRDASAGIDARTADAYRAKLKLFEDWIGDRPMNAVTIVDGSEYKAALMCLPPSWDEKIDGEANVREAVKLLGENKEKLTNVSIATYLGPPRSVFRWAQQNGHYDAQRINPFQGLTPPKPKGLKKIRRGRRVFETAELQKLFDAIPAGAERLEPPQSYVEIFWTMVPLLLWTGMRIGEGAQMHKAIIKKQGTIHYIDLGDSRVKSEAGARVIPVSRELEKLGFLKFVAKGDGSLWPTLTPDKYGRLGHHLPDRFKLYRDNLGLTGDRLGWHGLRKMFNQAMSDAGVEKETREAILGHEGDLNSTTYLPLGKRLAMLKEAVDAVKYPDLSLDRLKL